MARTSELTGSRLDPADRRETVLIIEDDPGVARLESMHLRRAGYVVKCAETTSAGFEALREGSVDLIVLDQNLQGDISGLDFFDRLRASGDQTPAILVTGLSDETTLIRAVRSGLSDFVPKTIEYFDDLIRAVERVIAQVRTRRKLAESEERLAGVNLLAQAIPQIVWTTRADGYLDFTNRRWFEYTGLDHEASQGWNWFQAIHPEDRERVRDEWNRSILSGELFQTEYRLKRGSDGAHRWFLVRGELVRDDSSQIVKWFGTCTDIDNQKQTEQELKRANEIAATASRAKDQFLAMLSHELRTPLTPAILAASSARDDSATPPHLRQVFQEIHQNLELEARLIDDLLDVMRIIRGKMPYFPQVTNVHVLINKAIEICRSEAAAKQLVTEIEFHASEYHANVDAARLLQVFWNLIRNAVKFTPTGGKIRIRTHDKLGRMIIEVSDTGIGIETTILPSIFNAFEQGEKIINRKYGGLGLGLSISRSIVEGHGGTLAAASAGRDRGATFILELPTEAPSVLDESEVRPTEATSVRPGNLRILLVEDDVMTSRILAKLLRENGYAVTTANDMKSALEVPITDYNLIISDIGLPDGTGLELKQRISMRHDVPGIALTGFGMEDDLRMSQEAGFLAHLTKPIDFSRLEAVLRKIGTSPNNSTVG